MAKGPGELLEDGTHVEATERNVRVRTIRNGKRVAAFVADEQSAVEIALALFKGLSAIEAARVEPTPDDEIHCVSIDTPPTKVGVAIDDETNEPTGITLVFGSARFQFEMPKPALLALGRHLVALSTPPGTRTH